MMKRTLSIVLAIILLSSSVFSLPASSCVKEQTMVYVLNSNQNPSKDNFARQLVASEQHTNILENFLIAAKDSQIQSDDALTYSGLTAAQYPPNMPARISMQTVILLLWLPKGMKIVLMY